MIAPATTDFRAVNHRALDSFTGQTKLLTTVQGRVEPRGEEECKFGVARSLRCQPSPLRTMPILEG